MVVSMSMNLMFYYISLLSIIGLLFTNIGIYIIPILLFYMLYLIVSIVPLILAWHGEISYKNLILKNIIYIVFTIIVYSILYVKSGLIIDGKLSNIDFSTAIYFSGTTWTTVGYGDISAPKDIRLLTTLEAINSYFAMAIFMSLIVLWLNDARESSQEYTKWLKSSKKEDIEEATGFNIDELEEKTKGNKLKKNK